MENSLLSVVLIARKNTSLSTMHALDSIRNQIYSPVRALVLDANEPNSIYSLGLQEDLAEYPEVDYRKVDPMLSIAGIRNLALSYMEGEYIAYLSSKDTWDSAKVLLQIEQLKEEREAAASCSNGVLVDKRRAQVAVEPLAGHMTSDASKWVLDNPAKMSAQVLYRRSALMEEGGFDEKFINFCDGDMLLRLSRKNKVLLLPVSLCECCITPEDEDYDWNNFKDSQYLRNKYMELFLVNRRMTLRFYERMMHLARLNYLWLNYLIYAFFYFIKAPGHTIFKLFRRIYQMAGYMVKWFCRTFSLCLEGLRIRRDIRLMRRGKFAGIKGLRPVTEAAQTEEKPVIFSSARQYNERSSLDYAFDLKLQSIVIPEYVTVIKKGMFYGCDRLVSVEIPNTVLEIQAHAFQKCRRLRRVTIEEGSRLGKLGAFAFAGCSALETLVLPSGVVRIGRGAFFECCSLKQMLFTHMHHGEEKASRVFPTALVKLSCDSFAGCSGLTVVEFGADSMLETIENGVFLGCVRLKKSLLTGQVKTLGSYAFAYCRRLETAAFPQIDTVKSIGKCAFMCCESLAYFQLPDQIEHINERTFYGCSSLKRIKIPKKVLSINHQAFAKCSSLRKAVILTGDITISPTAFEKHTELIIQAGVEEEAR